jgi:DNA-binding transcriptional LysR family regulator
VLLSREQGSGIREVVERGLLERGVCLRPLFTLTDNEAIKQMVMSGVGAAIVSAYSVRRELENGYLVQVAIADLDLKPQLSLIRRADRQLSRAAQVFWTFLCPAPSEEGELSPASAKQE